MAYEARERAPAVTNDWGGDGGGAPKHEKQDIAVPNLQVAREGGCTLRALRVALGGGGERLKTGRVASRSKTNQKTLKK